MRFGFRREEQTGQQPRSRSQQETASSGAEIRRWGHGVSSIKCKCCPPLRPAPWWRNPAPSGAVGFFCGSGTRVDPVELPLPPPAKATHHLQHTVGLISACRSPLDSQGRDEPRLCRVLAANPQSVHSRGSGRANYAEWHSESTLIRQISCWELEQTIAPLWEAADLLQTGSICSALSVIIFQIHKF